MTPPTWFRTLGIGAWLALGIAGVLALVLFLIALVAEVAIPLAIAAVAGGHSRTARRPARAMAAAEVARGRLSSSSSACRSSWPRSPSSSARSRASDEIWAQLEGSLQQVDNDNATIEGASDELIGAAHEVFRVLVSGLLGSLFSSASSFVFGTVLAIFMLLFLVKDWRQSPAGRPATWACPPRWVATSSMEP